MHASWATERCQPCDDGLGLERGRWRAGRSNRDVPRLLLPRDRRAWRQRPRNDNGPQPKPGACRLSLGGLASWPPPL